MNITINIIIIIMTIIQESWWQYTTETRILLINAAHTLKQLQTKAVTCLVTDASHF